MITTAKRKRKDQEELHSSPSKLPDNSRESEKENPLHPFSNRDYVACRFLAGTDPITCRKLEKKKRTRQMALGKRKKKVEIKYPSENIAYQQTAKKLRRHHIMTLMEEIHPVYATG